LKTHVVHEPVARGCGIFYIEVNVIKFHCFSPWELACLSILPFFEDLQVIPKKEGTLFPLRATRNFSEDMLGKRDLR
jgi:hypothetical protein